MTMYNGHATAVTDAGEAPVSINLRESRNGLHADTTGTVTITSMDAWKAIANNPVFRLRLPDGREGAFQAPSGTGMPPTPGNPTTFAVTRNDGETF
ncbi:hypothetical protein [Streptomyces sp. NPDC005385]|uniref:hypothetical protein n=1 Tax=Streptomyces sp. NPDC005385 TaxID=3157039 RepID=UPI0033AB45D8